MLLLLLLLLVGPRVEDIHAWLQLLVLLVLLRLVLLLLLLGCPILGRVVRLVLLRLPRLLLMLGLVPWLVLFHGHLLMHCRAGFDGALWVYGERRRVQIW